MKICVKCGIAKQREDFRKNREGRICRKCESAACMAWQNAHREHVKAYKRVLYKQHGEAAREATRLQSARWRESNREKSNAIKNAWRERYPAKRAADVRARQARLVKALPSWANKTAIHAFYESARRLTDATGVPHEVDHIVPLRHPRVCGLHNEYNLQVLPATQNRSKHNSFGGLV